LVRLAQVRLTRMMEENHMNKGKIIGRRIDFEDGRIVFLGAKSDMPEVNFVAFKNQHGQATMFMLSNEAFDALINLRADPDLGRKGEFPLPREVKFEWVQIKSEMT
jgi:hypothetical protein